MISSKELSDEYWEHWVEDAIEMCEGCIHFDEDKDLCKIKKKRVWNIQPNACPGKEVKE